jgi:hypothetical protein
MQDDYGYWSVCCGACGSSSGKLPDSIPNARERIIAGWNTRATERESAHPDDFSIKSAINWLQLEADLHPNSSFSHDCLETIGLIKRLSSPVRESAQPVQESDTLKRFSQWIKDNPNNPYAAMTLAVHRYFHGLCENGNNVDFGDDPYHDNEAMKFAFLTSRPKRESGEVEKRLKTAIGGLRSIAYGDAQTWPNCSSREVAKQALADCGGEK